MKAINKYKIKTKEMYIEPMDTNDVWEGKWIIMLTPKDEEAVQIGTASFAGEKANGTIPISVELMTEYQNKGYGTQVYKLMVDFAFGYRNIYEISAQTDRDNDKCVYALEKAGFVYRGREERIVNYSIIKPKTTWLGLYLYIGLICGMILGIVIGALWIGLIIGIVIGVVMGGIMESEAKKAREKITGHKE